MKHDRGLQCRCNSEDVTPYIIAINRCWALPGYIIHFVPDTHASQMLSTRIKAGGSLVLLGLEGAVGSGSVHALTPSLREEMEAGLAKDAVLWSEHSCCVVCAALELAGSSHIWVAHVVTSAVGLLGGSPGLSEMGGKKKQ